MRHAKIVCTIGPASSEETVLRRLIKAGMNCARLNFSHGEHADHGKVVKRIRKVAGELGISVAIMQDLQGPKIRTGTLREHRPVHLRKGDPLVITTREVEGNHECVSTTYKALPMDVNIGSRILLDDGRIELKVTGVKGPDVHCQVVIGGELSERKGINLPGTPVSAPSVTEKDFEDLMFGLEQDVDIIALSFVRSPEDIKRVRKYLTGKHINKKIVAKIERPEAVENLDAILDATDGVMVARGDLGVELDMARIAILQKDIIQRANAKGRFVITATEMLESMIHSPRPTRAEVSDVANAIYDGTDAVMLSGETARGEHPVETVEMMARIICEVEADLFSNASRFPSHYRESTNDPTQAMVDAGVHAVNALKCNCLGIFTLSGRTVWKVSKARPYSRIVALCSQEDAYRLLSIAWGVLPIRIEYIKDPAKLFSSGIEILKKHKLVKKGEIVLMIAGTSTALGTDNTLRFDVVK